MTVAPEVSRELVRRPGASERDPVRADRKRRWIELALGAGVPVLLLGLWQLAVNNAWLDTRTYPGPQQIFSSGVDLVEDGTLWDATWITGKRMILGWLIGVGLGLSIGLAMGTNRWVRKALEPTLDALYVVPKLALLPVFINMFGLGEGPKIALVAATVFFFVWVGTMAAAVSVPPGYFDTARVFGASRWRSFRDVLAPAMLPQIFVSLRVASGVALLVIVASEFIVGNTGLGYLIFNSRALFLNQRMYVGIVVVAVLGVAFAELIRQVARWATPWAPGDNSVIRR
jgi:sulfonate transport system permease protein